MPSQKRTILYADDDLDDLYMVQQAFEPFASLINLVHVYNGVEAINYLKKFSSENHEPCLVILDINMPGMDGREALMRIRQSQEFKDYPVALFTTSSSKADQEFARQWKAEFFTKPLGFEELQNLAGAFVGLCEDEIRKRA